MLLQAGRQVLLQAGRQLLLQAGRQVLLQAGKQVLLGLRSRRLQVVLVTSDSPSSACGYPAAPWPVLWAVAVVSDTEAGIEAGILLGLWPSVHA